jgi:hypothetical protein
MGVTDDPLEVSHTDSQWPAVRYRDPSYMKAEQVRSLVEDEAKAIAEAKAEIGEVRVNLNTTISHGGPVNTLIEEDCSEEAMARRFKQARRGEKQLKREADCD